MNIHEYQAKELLAKFGVPVPAGYAAMSVEEAVEAAKKLPGPLWVVKAQIHAGGRGKGKFKELGARRQGRRPPRPLDRRGARACRRDARQDAGHGPDRPARQAGPAALHHRRRRHRQGILPRAAGRPRERPHRRRRLDRGRHGHRDGRPRHAREDRHHHHRSGDRPDAAPRPRSRRRARPHRRPRQAGGQGARQALRRLRRHRRLADRDQPAGGRPTRASCWCSTPRSASTTMPSSATRTSTQLRDLTEEDPMEIEASKYDLAYIKLDGNIGCMVNGAGLAMATMDIIKLKAPSRPTSSTSAAAPTRKRSPRRSRSSCSDPAVKGILVNIFGGIMRCDIIAEGIVAAAREVSLERAAGGPARRHQCPAGQGHPRRQRPADHRRQRPRRRGEEDRRRSEAGSRMIRHPGELGPSFLGARAASQA